jgi:hypothetical protein
MVRLTPRPSRYRDEVEGQRWNQQRAPHAAVIAVWGTATLLGLAVAATTRIGPILLTVSSSHGVHLGDALAFVVAYGAAIMITRRLARTLVPSRTRRNPSSDAEAPAQLPRSR